MNDFNVNTKAYSQGVKLNIALDFDDTYTLHPELWNDVIEMFQKSGFNVYCVTARPDNHMEQVYRSLSGVIQEDMILNTSLRAKKEYVRKHHGIHIHVWIDDTPEAIVIPNYYDTDAEIGHDGGDFENHGD
jgi:acid phosphatase class B